MIFYENEYECVGNNSEIGYLVFEMLLYKAGCYYYLFIDLLNIWWVLNIVSVWFISLLLINK